MFDGQSHAVDAVVIGAGFSGLYQLYRLRELGMTTRVFEAGGDVGGTWYWNRYPGARCDSFSAQYSYSFSPELEQEWEWSETYPAQPEILRYLNHVADRFDLRREITFNTRVSSAHYDPAANRWTVTTDSGATVAATYLITAVGCLSTPNKPSFPGIDDFKGAVYHTGLWPHAGVDFSGRRVGVIGTGSTGIQAIPVIAEQAGQLYVFQRTPNFSFPARNRAVTPEEIAETKANYHELRAILRASPGGLTYGIDPQGSALEVSAEERERTFEGLWNRGGWAPLLAYTDLQINLAANNHLADFVRRKIASIVKDPATARVLTPTDHPIGTKRPPMDTNYFETYNRPNVTLVDVRNAPIEAITEKGLRTGGKEYELDAIVFATGFDAMTGPLFRIDIRGKDGMALKEKWAGGPKTYLGIQSEGFPNLFMITGPGSPSVLSNMPVSIEQHVEWISDCLKYMREHDLARIEPLHEAEEAWVAHVNEVANYTLYPLANSWYIGANIPGKPRIFMPYVGGVGNYRQKCAEVAARGYEGFALT
ncbi:MAG: NAD(P)/FAD-dependent oxidoreductase [Oscillochloris sp.]|nr:NAD(P)/FAD-dependent oxidoreductase [Oscillochloris sp.]